VSQYGIDPFGEDGPYGGPGLISILGLVPAARNRLIVVFDEPPLADDPKGLRSASNVANWRIEPVDPTIQGVNPPGYTYVPDGQVVPKRRIGLARARIDLTDRTQLHVWTDRDMEGGVRHRLSVVGELHGAACEAFAGPTVWETYAPFPAPVRVIPDRLDGVYRDLDDGALPGFVQQPGIWRYKSTGDIALQDELVALKKRILRRCTHAPGAFVWSTDGVDLRFGLPATASNLTALANAVADQARVDPLVSAAAVTAELVQTGGEVFVLLTISVELVDRRDLVLPLKILST
jgi:hypothetical protein